MTSRPPRWFDGLLLIGCRDRRLDAVLTALVAGLLAWSRFGLLAAGPWEWDETLFAHGLVKFSLAAHFPHPPGFPGWLAIGHLLLPVARDPLHALQLASAALSVVCLWPLTIIGRRVAPPAVALAAALLVLFLPGPWLHAVRGFSSTAAATLALCAVAAVINGHERHRITWFTVLIAAAFLVRPVLMPGFAVLWLGVAIGVRPLRRLLAGVLVSLAAGITAVVLMVWAEGGWQRFAAVFISHGTRHIVRLVENQGGWTELGLVKGLGGPWWAAVLLLAAAAGIVIWARRAGRHTALLWVLVLLPAIAQLVWLQNRTYSRYAVPVQLALAPLLAAAATMVPARRAAGSGLLLIAGLMGWRAYPLLVEQHTCRLPGWQAVTQGVAGSEGKRMALVVEGGLHPFASYHRHRAGGGELKGDPRLVLSPWAPEPWVGVDRPYLVATDHPDWYLAPLAGGSNQYGGVSTALKPFTQQRFLETAVISNPPLPIEGWWVPEQIPETGERFMWGTAGARLVLPPLPAGTMVELDLRPARGPAPLRLTVNDRLAAELPGDSPRTRIWLPPELLVLEPGTATTIVCERSQVYPPGGGDPRPLAVQVFAARAIGPGLPWHGAVATAQERQRLGISIDGAYPPEQLGKHGRACWLRPAATLTVPAGRGRLTLTMWAPRPLPAETVIRVSGRHVLGPLALENQPQEIEVPVHADDVRDNRVIVELCSVPYIPAATGRSRDRRKLGIVLQAVRFQPPPEAVRQWTWPPANG
jgi:hypothetical protein